MSAVTSPISLAGLPNLEPRGKKRHIQGAVGQGHPVSRAEILVHAVDAAPDQTTPHPTVSPMAEQQ